MIQQQQQQQQHYQQHYQQQQQQQQQYPHHHYQQQHVGLDDSYFPGSVLDNHHHRQYNATHAPSNVMVGGINLSTHEHSEDKW